MDDLIEWMRRRRHEREAIWELLVDAILSAEVPGAAQPVSTLVRAVLSRDPQAAAAEESLSKCGIWFGHSGDFVGVYWWRPNVPCMAISAATVSEQLLHGTAWDGAPVKTLESALELVPGHISGWDPDSDFEPPVVLIGRTAAMKLLSRPDGPSQPPGGCLQSNAPATAKP